ncbi:uncharacterized protein HD556DRAFT_1436222 [Suillus plorans]|uniref:Uncharacterized protein n=1 Tax=Suillus plorans TaxID=116603 RepID=A0A9P7JA87_9AGAM|nr:uncharacterized protein HD556DRAFT_1436222 [Suillus plorans]KAG1810484.1 hypothetical protein HD556DRAFT_1436222 [Suillus plorans]
MYIPPFDNPTEVSSGCFMWFLKMGVLVDARGTVCAVEFAPHHFGLKQLVLRGVCVPFKSLKLVTNIYEYILHKASPFARSPHPLPSSYSFADVRWAFAHGVRGVGNGVVELLNLGEFTRDLEY